MLTTESPVSWRIYRDEWVSAHVAYQHGDEPPIKQATAYFDEHYAGRVREDDVRYVVQHSGHTPIAALELRLPTVKGEFKIRADADAYVQRTWGATCQQVYVVDSGGPADTAMRNYGVTKLPTPAACDA